MNELQVFNFESNSVRALVINNEPWFVAKDAAKTLGYKNPRDAISKHVDDEDKEVAKCDTLGGRQDIAIINESGLYALIFGSKLESAKKFKRWVTSEVLPSLRKTGSYAIPTDPMSALKLMFEAQTQTNEKVASCDKRITDLEENKKLEPSEYNCLSEAVRKKVKQVKSELKMELSKKQNSQLYRAINHDLDSYVGVKTRVQIKAKDFDKAMEFVEDWQLSYADRKIIEQLALEE